MKMKKIMADRDQVIATCAHCRAQIWTYPENWVEGLKKEATRLGWRLEANEKNLEILCECEFHRTDVIKKWSFVLNDQRKHQGGDNLSSSGWYGRYQKIQGLFAMENMPFLFSKLFPWNYFGSSGGFEARGLYFSENNEEFLKDINKLPEGQFVNITNY